MNNSSFEGFPQSNSGRNPRNLISYLSRNMLTDNVVFSPFGDILLGDILPDGRVIFPAGAESDIAPSEQLCSIRLITARSAISLGVSRI